MGQRILGYQGWWLAWNHAVADARDESRPDRRDGGIDWSLIVICWLILVNLTMVGLLSSSGIGIVASLIGARIAHGLPEVSVDESLRAVACVGSLATLTFRAGIEDEQHGDQLAEIATPFRVR